MKGKPIKKIVQQPEKDVHKAIKDYREKFGLGVFSIMVEPQYRRYVHVQVGIFVALGWTGTESI